MQGPRQAEGAQAIAIPGGQAADVVGREAELAALEAFVDAREELPRALVLEGEAGLGKTTLLRAGVEAARGRSYRVLGCAPGEAESELSFAALRDLLEGAFDGIAADLPAPQRRALAVALLRQEPGADALDPGAVATGFLAALRLLAAGSPVLVAVDDAQWLDPPSASVLAYAARRLRNEPVALLLSWRTEGAGALPLALDRALPDDRLQRLRPEPLTLGALYALLSTRLDHSFPRPVLVRVHDASGGNPLFALEIGRALQRRGALPPAGERLPIPERLHDLVNDRLATLPTDTRLALGVAAALSHPTLPLVSAATGLDAGVLDAAVRAHVLELDGERIRFTHPLLSSAAYAALEPGRRRAVHRRLAELLDDPEERARHLAPAAAGPDESVATALEEAARDALTRGAPEAAASLAEQALGLTPAGQSAEHARRTADAGDYHLRAGDTGRARVLLEQAVSELPRGEARARALHRLATVRYREESYAAVEQVLERALAEAEDPTLRAAIESDLVTSLLQSGELRRAAPHARAALELAERHGERALLALALSTAAMVEFLLGNGIRGELMERALALAGAERGADLLPALAEPAVFWAVMLKWADDFEAAHPRLEAIARRVREHDEEGSLPSVLFQLAELECWLGNLESAERYARECREAALLSGQPSLETHPLYVEALVAAHVGRVEDAVAAASRALVIAERVADQRFVVRCLAVLGFTKLSLGDAAEADRQLGRAAELTSAAGYGEPGVVRFLPDAIEALVLLERLEQAETLTERLEERGATLERPWAQATGARCRALLAAARGDLPGALGALERARAAHERLPMPLERARTLLVLGRVQRRAKQKRAARASLAEALELFDGLGARLWAEQARSELARIGGRRPASDELTPTERRLAELVADGRSNKEAAAALFVTPRTVETQLSRIYRKLGVRSRTELANRLAGEAEAGKL